MIREYEANKGKAGKIELAYKLLQNRYNKREISYKAKIRHNSTVIKSEGLSNSECLVLNNKLEMKELDKKEKNILRKILGSEKRKDINGGRRKSIPMRREDIRHHTIREDCRFTGTLYERTKAERRLKFPVTS